MEVEKKSRQYPKRKQNKQFKRRYPMYKKPLANSYDGGMRVKVHHNAAFTGGN